MLKHIKARINKPNGFTFVEMLVSLAIIVMVTALVATSVPVAIKTYTKAVDGANAQLAISTTTAKLRDELNYARDVDCSADGKVLHYMTGDGYWASIDEDDDYRGLIKHVFAGELANLQEVDGSPYPLLQDAAITDHLRVCFDDSDTSGIYYEDGIFQIKGLEVKYTSGDDAVLVKVSDSGENVYEIRAENFN